MAIMSENNRWIAWEGGDCPLDADAGVEVQFRDGSTEKSTEAVYWRWYHDNSDEDIVAYRQTELSLSQLRELEHPAYLYIVLRDMLIDAGCPITGGCHIPTVVGQWLDNR